MMNPSSSSYLEQIFFYITIVSMTLILTTTNYPILQKSLITLTDWHDSTAWL